MPLFERVSAELPVTLKTASYALVAEDTGTEIQFQSGSAVTAGLPPVSAVENGYNVILRDVGSGALTLQPQGGETIDGQSSLALTTGQSRWIRNDGTEWKTISSNAGGIIGDVTGPSSATDNAIARFDGTTGKLIQNSTAIIDDGGNLAVSGTITATGNITGANLSGTNTGDQTITLTGDVTGSGTGSFAATIADNAVTYAKMQDVSAASRLLGRGDSGAGDPQEITLGTGLTMSGTTLSSPDQTITLTGDVTGSGTGSFATTIAAGAVTTAKIADGAVTVAKLADAAKPYDFSFIAGFDGTIGEITIVAQSYATVVIARDLTIEGDVGTIVTPSSSGNVTLDVKIGSNSIYNSPPTFAASTGSYTAGSLNSTYVDVSSGQNLTFSVTGAGTGAKGVRFTLKARLR